MVKALTIDFWETLYFHVGTPEQRRGRRAEAMARRLEVLGVVHPTLAETFFNVVDGYIKGTWAAGVCPTRHDALRHAFEHYGTEVPESVLACLLEEIVDLYLSSLQPTLALGAREFMAVSASRWPVWLVSDTYTLNGDVLERILERDDMRKYFRECFYSDRVGRRKPDPAALIQIAEGQKIQGADVLHIGDLVRTDGELARRAGAHCIIINHRDPAPEDVVSYEGTVVGWCHTFTEVERVLSCYA